MSIGREFSLTNQAEIGIWKPAMPEDYDTATLQWCFYNTDYVSVLENKLFGGTTYPVELTYERDFYQEYIFRFSVKRIDHLDNCSTNTTYSINE